MPSRIHHVNRRELLRGMGAGVMAASFGAVGLWPTRTQAQVPEQATARDDSRQLFAPCTKGARVSLVKGNDRREIVLQALKNIEDQVLASLGDKRKILIKPNFVVTTRELCATHVDAVRGIYPRVKTCTSRGIEEISDEQVAGIHQSIIDGRRRPTE